MKYRLTSQLNDTSEFYITPERLEKTYTERDKHVYLNDREKWANPFDSIQANARGTDIYEIIGRVLNGDTSYSFDSNWQDADYSLFTQPLLDMQQKVQEARRLFNAMPLDIRNKYGNDFDVFAQNFSFDELMKKTDKVEEPNTEKDGESNV